MTKFILVLLLVLVARTQSFGYAGSLMYMEKMNVDEGSLNHIQESQPDTVPDEFQFPGQVKKVALFYGKGTWNIGRKQLKNFLYSQGRSYKVVYENEILNGSLNRGGYHTLVMPGGKSWIYNENLGAKGAQEILKFVNAGGNYIGICAGAFYATSYRQGPSPTPVLYGIGLLNGIAFDGTALKVQQFKSGMNNYPFLLAGFPKQFRILLLGGPALLYDANESKLKKIQVYSLFSQNMPSMVAFEFGKGRVFLSGPHLEVEEHQSIIGVRYKDPDSEWPILDHVFRNFFLR
jgi:glutamine amidotransferase-like uncharacterized protein